MTNYSKVLLLERVYQPDTGEVDSDFKNQLATFYHYLAKRLNIKKTPKVKLIKNQENADKGVLGLTGHYNPDTQTVAIFIIDRHPSDVLRSFGHEVVHHWQHENGKLKNTSTPFGYAQTNPHMRTMEMQANMLGSMIYRDWQDQERKKEQKNSSMVECKKCGCQIDYNNVSESRMGFIKCPECLTEIDQEGNFYG